MTYPDAALRKRCPNGVRSDKRLQVSLAPDELADLKARARDEGRSDSNMAWVLLIRAMAAHQQKLSDGATSHAPTQLLGSRSPRLTWASKAT
ncbi:MULTISPECIES: ribbon-helix-helix domain-containing protein [Ralstonia]|uniref:ribbon-helix-helix domain-containing protein n=1 Tax=Ralstonia TaxID=48736 RepID=UPI0007DC055B|nr:hypothetical protein [Ralstonia insidiosa]